MTVMLKRLRRKIVISVVSVMLLFGATSVYAYDNWADTLHDAYSLNGPISGVSTTINSSVDVDWFKWTNDTGSTVNFNAHLQSPQGLNYDFSVVLSNGTWYLPFGSADDTGNGGIDIMSHSVSHGHTVYFQVRGQKATDYSSTAPYNFTLYFSP